MNSNNMKEILLIGPGISLETLDPNLVKTIPSLYFGSCFNWFEKNGVTPTFYTFADPNTITYFDALINGLSAYDKSEKSKYRYDYHCIVDYVNDTPPYSKEFLAKLKKSTTLIYSDLQGSDKFYPAGFSTSRGPDWFTGVFKNDVLPRVETFFKDTKIFPQVISKNYDWVYNDTPLEVSPYNHGRTLLFNNLHGVPLIHQHHRENQNDKYILESPLFPVKGYSWLHKAKYADKFTC